MADRELHFEPFLHLAALGDDVGVLRHGEHSDRQMSLARALERAADAHDVRFVLTVGDNVYLGTEGTVTGAGDEDDDWYGSFYQPYRYLLNRLPFFPAGGNHDDRFGVGALLEFVCIDTSLASEIDVEHYFDDPRHLEWVRDTLQRGGARAHHGAFRSAITAVLRRAAPRQHDRDGAAPGAAVSPGGRSAGAQRPRAQLPALGRGRHRLRRQWGGRQAAPRGADRLRLRRHAGLGLRGALPAVAVDAERIVVHPVADVREDGALELIELRDPAGAGIAAPVVVA